MRYKTARIILGLFIIFTAIVSIFTTSKYLLGVYTLIVVTFGLLALVMNYNYEEKDRNAWDVWFFSMPGLVVALFLIGVLANDKEIWKWSVIALGGAAGLESLSSFIKKRLGRYGSDSKNHFEEQKISSKALWDKIMIFGTLLMAATTVWLGWETRQIRLDDLVPRIEIKDVGIQAIDQTGSILKDWSWLEGEKYNPNAAEKPSESMLVAIKFSNGGKQIGYVELTNYSELIEKFQSGGSSEAFVMGRIAVTGGGETGWVYPINIIKFQGPNFNVDIPYIYNVYDSRGNRTSKERYVRCTFYSREEPYLNPVCKPIQK